MKKHLTEVQLHKCKLTLYILSVTMKNDLRQTKLYLFLEAVDSLDDIFLLLRKTTSFITFSTFYQITL